MQFGVFYQLPHDPNQTHAQRYDEMIDLICYAETLGFDVAWLAEIHFSGAFSILSSPLMVIPAIAARTQRIRLGTAVTVLPLQNPLSYAEQVATADILSGGYGDDTLRGAGTAGSLGGNPGRDELRRVVSANAHG